MYDLDLYGNIQNIIKYYDSKDIWINKKDIYFINPKFELILVLCKKNITPIDNYSKYIKDIYGIDNYRKTDKQLKQIIEQIGTKDIKLLFFNIDHLLSKDDNELRSTNYELLFQNIFEIYSIE